MDLAFVGDRPGAVNFVAVAPGEAAALLAPLLAMSKVNHAPLCGVADLVGGGQSYIAYQRGEALAVVCLDKVQWQNGRALEVRAALSLTGRGDVTETILPAIELAFGWDCDEVTIYTMRPGLVRKLEEAGYQSAATILRKKL